MNIVKRELYSEIEPYIHSPEAIVITGMRRTGKTTLLRMIFDEIESGNKLFLDLENPLNQKYFLNENYDAILPSLAGLGIRSDRKAYLFLDEIQSLPNIPAVIKYLSDHFDVKFFLSGSASFYLKNLFSESLSGRKFLFELHPFSFQEFLRFKNVPAPILPNDGSVSDATHLRYDGLFDEYLRYGGFPAVVAEEAHEGKLRKLDDIFSSYWSLEVERLSDFRKKDKVRDLIFLLLGRTGSRLDVAKLSREIGVAQRTLFDYLAFFEDTYLISTVSPFSRNPDTEIRGAKRLYFIDTGLLNHFGKVPEGDIFENACYTALCRRGEVRYYQKKSGQEIDFILDEAKAFEAKLSAQSHDVAVLSRRTHALGIDDYSVISKTFSKADHVTFGFLL